ncbi:MAG TPA: hypothetical protein VJC39_05280 [Candidatus Nanoarchaeia archaeon]|nr:hypothetical protein [Candidatus Nanoarchaeia archaeon]
MNSLQFLEWIAESWYLPSPGVMDLYHQAVVQSEEPKFSVEDVQQHESLLEDMTKHFGFDAHDADTSSEPQRQPIPDYERKKFGRQIYAALANYSKGLNNINASAAVVITADYILAASVQETFYLYLNLDPNRSAGLMEQLGYELYDFLKDHPETPGGWRFVVNKNNAIRVIPKPKLECAKDFHPCFGKVAESFEIDDEVNFEKGSD